MWTQVTPGEPGVKPATIKMIDANTKVLMRMRAYMSMRMGMRMRIFMGMGMGTNNGR